MLLRSVLFVPGNNMRMIYKATKLDADAYILDLEDAVPMVDKETGRVFVRDSLQMLKEAGQTVFVRVNGLRTGLTEEDLRYVVQPGLDGVVLPKCDGKEDVERVDAMVRELELQRGLEEGSVKLLPLIETTRGFLRAEEIATSSERVIGLGFGAVDFTRELGASLSKEGIEILYARSHVAIVAKAHGLHAIDTPWLDIMDMEGLLRDAQMARRLGFSGKLLIHPKQIRPVKEIFTPSKEEVEFARRVVEEFEKARARGVGAISLEGTMIDEANYRQAKLILELMELIEAKEKARRKR
ncbi:MAG TPA: CoA ester lyase [Candidatus Bathyarchaeota archaeon]|nr:CoA ester lyase [Candidatus Bathyarchaeota archaeon]